MLNEEIYKSAINLWGKEAQTLMAFEEMSELQKELCKNARGKENRNAIAEEIADVRIMLDQIEIIYNCKDLAQRYKAEKLSRLQFVLSNYCPNCGTLMLEDDNRSTLKIDSAVDGQ